MLKNEKEISINYINSLRVETFRSHEDFRLSPGQASVLIVGANGAGKTSLLEAISIFSYGKGIRNAKFSEMININKKSFAVNLDLQISKNFSLEYKTFYNIDNKIRKTYINEKEALASNIRRSIPMLWIAPYNEKIFTGSSSQRRNFIDRLVNIFDERHSARLNEYEKILKQRTKLLKEDSSDINWIETLEKQLSMLSVAICSSRLEIVVKISDFLETSIENFPKVRIKFINAIENKIEKAAAIDVESELTKSYYENRALDKLLGGSRVGCQKSDIDVLNLDRGLSTSMCSSGEQKSVLISIIIATAISYREYTKKSPIILLDEIFTHLDLEKKNSLLNKLINLKSQIWITATEKESFFQNNSNFCYHYLNNNNSNNS